VLILGWLAWRGFSSRRPLGEAPVPAIDKQPVAFASRMFDPAAPPADMPPLAPGESAECDSQFLSSASVRGESRETDATHATVTITQIKVTLQLNINIWVPTGATQHVIEHEDGHRQISEYYYQTAGKLAGRIAAAYMGKQVEIRPLQLFSSLFIFVYITLLYSHPSQCRPAFAGKLPRSSNLFRHHLL
jgi:hypothetical protein